MAKGNIETFTGNVEAPRADQAGSAAFEQLGRHVAASYDQAGSSIAQAGRAVGNAYEQHQAIVDTTALGKGFADIEDQTRKAEEEAKITADPHDPEFVQKFMDAQQEKVDALGADVQSDEGKRLFQQLSNSYRVNTFNRLTGWQAQAAAADTMAKAEQTVTTYSNMAQSDPTSAKNFAVNITAQAQALPTEVRGKWINEATQRIYDSAGEGILNKLSSNPGATMDTVETAKAYLTDPKNGFIDHMSPQQYASVNARIDKAGEQIGAVASQIAAQKFEAGVAQVKMNGGVVSPELQSTVTNYRGSTPEETQKWKAEHQQVLNDAAFYGKTAKEVNATPDAQLGPAILAAKDKLKTAPLDQAPELEARIKAAEEAKKARDEAFKSDPATWLNQNSEVVKSRYATFSANQTAENFQAYAAASLAEQRRLYPNEVPNIMPAEMEDTIRGQLKIDLTTKEGPVAAGNILSSYARVAGQYWPQMAIKLRQDKVLPAGMGVAAELYGNPRTQALGEEVIRATAVPPEQRMERYGVTKEKADAAASVSLKPLMKTMGNIPNSDEIILDYRYALGAIFQYNGTVTPGPDPREIGDASKKMIMGRYDIQGDTLRIPKSLGLDPRRIGDGAASVKGDLGNHDIVLPPHFKEMSVSRESYIRQLRDTGHWYANENGTGAILYDEDMHTVKETIGGKQHDVELSWEALGQVADKTPLRATVKAAAGLLGDK